MTRSSSSQTVCRTLLLSSDRKISRCFPVVSKKAEVTALLVWFFFSLFNQATTEKMVHALAERNCELQLLRQHVLRKEPVGIEAPGTALLKQDRQQPVQVRVTYSVLPAVLGLWRECIATGGTY